MSSVPTACYQSSVLGVLWACQNSLAALNCDGLWLSVNYPNHPFSISVLSVAKGWWRNTCTGSRTLSNSHGHPVHCRHLSNNTASTAQPHTESYLQHSQKHERPTYIDHRQLVLLESVIFCDFGRYERQHHLIVRNRVSGSLHFVHQHFVRWNLQLWSLQRRSCSQFCNFLFLGRWTVSNICGLSSALRRTAQHSVSTDIQSLLSKWASCRKRTFRYNLSNLTDWWGSVCRPAAVRRVEASVSIKQFASRCSVSLRSFFYWPVHFQVPIYQPHLSSFFPLHFSSW